MGLLCMHMFMAMVMMGEELKIKIKDKTLLNLEFESWFMQASLNYV